ncbi:hypothetical protein FWH30_00350 [Microgenomates group bacterium]|nr:hypothetical protein [Microgenomates group bacterium]
MKRNPLNIVLVALIGIFIVLVILFIRQITRRPAMQARLDGGTSNVITSSVIPTPAANPTLTTDATLSAQIETQTDIDPDELTVVTATPTAQIASIETTPADKGHVVVPTPTPTPLPTPTPVPTKTVVTEVKEETVTTPASRPSSNPYLAGCGEYNKDTDSFSATIKFPKMDGKTSMTVQVGSSYESNDLYEGSFVAASEQAIRVTAKNNTNYFARYRFDDGSWSNSLEFSCVRR